MTASHGTSVLDATAGVEVADRAVKAALAAGADAAKVLHGYSELYEITFDNTDVGMIRTTVDDTVSMTVYVGGAKGQSTVTGRSNDLIEQAAAEAVAAARSGIADPANSLYDGETTSLVELGDREPDPDTMIDTIVRHQEYVAKNFPKIRMRDSTYDFVNSWKSFANSNGLQHQERRAAYRGSAMFSAKDGARQTSFNYTGASSVTPFEELRQMATLDRLLSDVSNSFDPRSVPETFVGDVIFTPDSATTLINTVLQSLTGYTLMRGTSPFQNAVGEQIADARLTVRNQPRSSLFPLSMSFDGDGVPSCDLPIITNGVLDNHLVDWYTSKKLDRPMTGSVFSVSVDPGDQSYEELVANTERGIILGRFSGGQPNQQLDFSGVAKNSFYVEKGKVLFPIAEVMIAGNFRQLLNSIRAIGDQTVNYGGHAYPYIATTGVTISTK